MNNPLLIQNFYVNLLIEYRITQQTRNNYSTSNPQLNYAYNLNPHPKNTLRVLPLPITSFSLSQSIKTQTLSRRYQQKLTLAQSINTKQSTNIQTHQKPLQPLKCNLFDPNRTPTLKLS